MYELALKNLGVKKIPTTAVARARLLAKLNKKIAKKTIDDNLCDGYKTRGLQRRTWGNKGEGY